LTTRIAIGKGLGALFGIAGFIYLTYFPVDGEGLLRWGVLLWYATLGAIIGFAGVYTWHPVLKLPMPWWIRAPVIGAWLNFVLTFFAYDAMASLMASIFGPGGVLASPFWFAAEGALIGLVIGFFATRFGGEGAKTVMALPDPPQARGTS
jgi:hypothetical protein